MLTIFSLTSSVLQDQENTSGESVSHVTTHAILMIIFLIFMKSLHMFPHETEEIRSFHVFTRARFIQKKGPNMKLDIGCGGNKKQGFTGVDINPGEQVDFVMDVRKLEFEDNSIDEIFSRRCIQHVEDDEKALSEIFRILKPNGIFTLEVASWYGWLFYRLHLSPSYGAYKIFHSYRDSKLKKMLEKAGFAIESLRHIPSPRGLGYDIQVICKKEVSDEKPA